MTVENISWSNLHERMLQTPLGGGGGWWNMQPPDHQPDAHPAEPPRPASDQWLVLADPLKMACFLAVHRAPCLTWLRKAWPLLLSDQNFWYPPEDARSLAILGALTEDWSDRCGLMWVFLHARGYIFLCCGSNIFLFLHELWILIRITPYP